MPKGNIIMSDKVFQLKYNGNDITLTLDDDSVVLKNGEAEIKLSAGVAYFNCEPDIDDLDISVESFDGDPMSGLTVHLKPLELEGGGSVSFITKFKWYEDEGVLRKDVSYSFDSCNDQIYVKEIVIDKFKLDKYPLARKLPDYSNGANNFNHPSHPLIFESFFAGIEFPVATSRSDAKASMLAHAPEFMADCNTEYNCRTAVFGICRDSMTSWESFNAYMLPHMQINDYMDRFYIGYNTWWSQYDLPFGEKRMLDLIESVYEPMKKYGETFDNYLMDNGWADMYSIWNISKERFPQGFKNLNDKLKEYDSSVGIWYSPASVYEHSTNIDWARENGYVIDDYYKPPRLCMYDKRYTHDIANNLADIIHEYDIKAMKADGLFLRCMCEGHEHLPGAGAVEQSADNAVHLFKKLREAVPDVILEIVNCFGNSNPSPWWLWYTTLTNGNHGDDSPCGMVPCPIYRESYTTSRAFFAMQGAVNFDIPIQAQFSFGCVHQTNDDFTNDYIDCFMRGQSYVAMYINPDRMTDERWKRTAGIVNWMRKNQKSIVSYTQPIRPDSWTLDGCYPISYKANAYREPYGYYHEGMIYLRNPWIKSADKTVKVPAPVSFSDESFSLVSVYPEVRVYAEGVKAGDEIKIPMAGYETLVLVPYKSDAVNNIPCVAPHGEDEIEVNGDNFTADEQYSIELTGGSNIRTFDYSGKISCGDNDNTLLVLIEADDKLNVQEIQDKMKISVNGESVTPEWHGTDIDPWDATGVPRLEHWLYACVPLASGKNKVKLNYMYSGKMTRTGGYVWSVKHSSNGAVCENMLPSPEYITTATEELYSTEI